MDTIALPKSRREAKEIGAMYYFTSMQCKNSHISRRQTNNGNCVQCNRGYSNAHYSRNVSSRIELVNIYRNRNPRKAKKWARTSYQNAKPAYFARVRRRELAKINRTPPWLSVEQLAEITRIYKERERLQNVTGELYHVDHIVPLQGRNVSGLHVPWNLRVISAYENLTKGSKLLQGVA